MKKIFFRSVFAFALLSLHIAGLSQEKAKSDTIRNGALKLFLDCRSCDINYTREEIPYVNYVRDTYTAEVYLLVTSQNASSGGQQFTFTFQGDGKYQGMNDTLVYTSNPDETSTIIREKKTNMIKMGLMRYVARTPLAGEIEIKSNSDLRTEEVIDKWNNWVFELRTSPRFNAEETYRRFFIENAISVSKVTEEFKIESAFEMGNNKQTFIEDGVESVYIRKDRALDNLFVKSLGDHWSAGLVWDLAQSTSENYDFNTEFLPSVEYNLFPYSMATHKQLRFLYSVGYEFSNYIDSTIYNKTEESLFKQELRVAYQIQEKWGSVNVSLTGSNYFHDFSKNMVELSGFIRLRILKGLSLSVNGGVAYINDQLNLAKGDLSEAERLLRLKEQATNFEIGGGASLTYTFGSIYSNVVNPRFGNGGGGGGGGFY